MTDVRRVNRFWGLLPLALGIFLEVEGWASTARSWAGWLMMGFGLLLIASGLYTLATGIALSRWRG